MQSAIEQSEFARLREQAGLSIEQVAAQVGFSVRTVYRWDRGDAPARKVAIHFLKELVEKAHCSTFERPTFRFIDLFAGIGGLRRGFEPLGGKCVYTSERDRYAQLTYKANFECDHEINDDITQAHVSEIPAHDILLAGFPCQPFSIAGVSKLNSLKRPHGFRCDAQGTLFFDVARILEYHRPQAFLLENVKNLVNHDKGRTFEVIYKILTEELGYHVDWKIVDARSWVPQHRERIFIAGFREPNGFSFDDFEIPDPRRGPRMCSVLHPEDGSEEAEPPYSIGPEARVSGKYTLSDKLWNYLQQYAAKHRAAGNGFGFGLVGPNDVSRTLSARYFKDGSEILVERKGQNPRRLTPRECARLMGFDTPGASSMAIPVSDTQAYKQFGNAVAVPCVEAVARHMAPWLGVSAEAGMEFSQLRLPLVG